MLNDYLLNESHFVCGKNKKWAKKGLVCLLITFIDTTHFMPYNFIKVRKVRFLERTLEEHNAVLM